MTKLSRLIRKLSTIAIVAACVAAIVVSVAGYGIYIETVKKSLNEDAFTILDALSSRAVMLVKERINADIKNIQVRADAASSIGDYTSNAMHDFIVSTSENDTKSSRVILSKADGESFSSDGMSGNLSGEESFQRALAGESVLTRVDGEQVSPEENVVMISVPVKQADGTISGVLSCVYMAAVYGDIMDINDLDSAGRYCVVDGNARFIMHSGDMIGAELTAENTGLKEDKVTAIRDDILAGKSGNILTKAGEKKDDFLSYIPIGVNDWYLVSFIPSEEISGKTMQIYRLVALVTGGVFLLLIAAFVVLTIIQKRMRAHLEHQAYYDSLTDIPNVDMLRKFYGELPNNGKGYVYLHLHVDNFKQAITVFGYETGNNILKAIAGVLSECVGTKEIASRLREDAFALLLKFDEDMKFSARINQIMERLEKVEATDGAIVFAYSSTFNCGLYSITGEEKSFDDIVNMARFTATLIHNYGGESYAYTNDDIQEKLKVRNRLLSEASQALQEKQLVAYIQPKYDINTKKVTAAEVFSRWKHPELGIISPSEFLSVFELSGDIITLDLYMFEEACGLMKKWIDEEQMPVPLSVNISPFNFYEVNFVEKIMEIVQQYNVPSCLMNLEIDQKALMSHQTKTAEVMEEFHDKGFILSVDNFGYEHVPLDIFYRFPIDVLNLSASFVQKARDNEEVRGILETVINTAKAQNMVVSASGVELEEQEAFLKELSCEMVQGYFYSKPQPREEFEKMIF